MRQARHTVLVIAQAEDGTARQVIDALLARDAVVASIDTADFPRALSLVATPECLHSPGYLCLRGGRIDLASVRSVYRRSPARFTFPAGMSDPERRFATLGSTYGLGGVLAAQSWRWIDHPGRVADASYKPRQLRVAAESGLNVPRSLVTNVGAQAREFAAEVGGKIVYKSLSTGVIAERDEARIIYTSRLTSDELDDSAIALCCHLFQQWVHKSFDVRLTVPLSGTGVSPWLCMQTAPKQRWTSVAAMTTCATRCAPRPTRCAVGCSPTCASSVWSSARSISRSPPMAAGGSLNAIRPDSGDG